MQRILGIHGISEGGNAKMHMTFARPAIDGVASLSTALGQPVAPHQVPFSVAAYADEINALPTLSIPQNFDPTQIIKHIPILSSIAGLVHDYVRDVFTYSTPQNVAAIKACVRAQITSNGPCVVLAHSLGSVVVADILIDMLAEGLISPTKPIDQWPIQGLLTCGSPLGIDIPMFNQIGYRNRLSALAKLPSLPRSFRWVNLYDTNDPVVSGSALGLPGQVVPLSQHPALAAVVKDVEVDTGRHLLSHISYFENFILHQHLYALAAIPPTA